MIGYALRHGGAQTTAEIIQALPLKRIPAVVSELEDPQSGVVEIKYDTFDGEPPPEGVFTYMDDGGRLRLVFVEAAKCGE